MRWSRLFIPTLRDAPADAEAASHRLLIRGGFIRQLHAGHYSLLPLGLRVHDKVEGIVREEMDAIGGQEFLLPAMHPAAVWEQSGRWELMGDEMFRLTDRKGASLALGMTHEEVFATVGTELSSYRSLPQIWYQIQWKFRDEPRPKSGLLRVREFAMKDSYSFDIDEAGLDRSFELHHDAYVRIFDRLGLPAMPVEASSGSMGGSGSIEFMVPSPAGEDDVVRCGSCGYAANIERATARVEEILDQPGADATEKFATPGVVTIAALAAFEGGAPADRQLKSLVMIVDGGVVLAVVRGDHQLSVQKLSDVLGASDVRPAEPDETRAALGAKPGSLGPVGVNDVTVVMDHALAGRTNMVTGANEDGFHIRGVDVARDVDVDLWADVREVRAGEACPTCGEPLELIRCIEAGHIFKLGSKYTEAMGVTVLDEDGIAQVPIMGSYGIGIGRAVAAIAETHHDDDGLEWPVAVAPYEVVITLVSLKDEPSVTAAEALHDELQSSGIDVLLDDRDARAGVKFADAELIGVPYRITIGPKAIAEAAVELTPRATGETTRLPLDTVASMVTELVMANR